MRTLKCLWQKFFPDYMAGKGESIGKNAESEEFMDLVQKMPEFFKQARGVIAHNHGS